MPNTLGFWKFSSSIILMSGCYSGVIIIIILLTGGWYSGTVKDWFLIKGGVRVLQELGWRKVQKRCHHDYHDYNVSYGKIVMMRNMMLLITMMMVIIMMIVITKITM